MLAAQQDPGGQSNRRSRTFGVASTPKATISLDDPTVFRVVSQRRRLYRCCTDVPKRNDAKVPRMPVSSLPREPRVSRAAGTPLVAVVAVFSAIVAAFADAAPTGTVVWDETLTAALAMGVVFAGSKSPRWAVIVMSALAAAVSLATLWAFGAWLALVMSLVSVLLNHRSRMVGAVVAGIAVQSVLRLPPVGFFGLQSIIAVVAIAPVLVMGYRYGTKRARQLARWSLAATATVLAVVALFGGLALLNARSNVAQGITAARSGLVAGRAGNTESVANELERAEQLFTSATDGLTGFGARSLRLVPIASQHQRAIENAVTQGGIVTAEAAAAVRNADIRNLRLAAGALDLDALSAMAPRLRSTSVALDNAVLEIRSGSSQWLVPPLADRIEELLKEIGEFQPEIEVSAAAAEVLPGLLGQVEPKTYFVMFGTPAESRELGGFLGSWALLSFDQGRLQLGESGRINELYDTASARQVPAGIVSDWYLEMARPAQFPQNLPSSPDMAQVAAVSRQVLAGVSDRPIDGFIYADGYALADMLQLSGPVTIPFQGAALNSDNAAQFFFEDQYRVDDGQGRTDLFDTLAQVAAGVVAGVNNQTLPGPEELGRVMGPAARGGHLQVVTFDDEANDFLRSVRLLRDFGRNGTQDFVGLVQTNGLSNKMDLYLHRQLDYRATIAENGDIEATAQVTLSSDVPSDAPALTLGSGATENVNKVLLSLYSPLALDGVTVNGVPGNVRIAAEFDMGRYLVEVDVPPNAAPTMIEFSLSGSASTTQPYSLEVWHQPLINDDEVSIRVVGPKFVASWEGSLTENVVVSADSAEPS